MSWEALGWLLSCPNPVLDHHTIDWYRPKHGLFMVLFSTWAPHGPFWCLSIIKLKMIPLKSYWPHESWSTLSGVNSFGPWLNFEYNPKLHWACLWRQAEQGTKTTKLIQFEALASEHLWFITPFHTGTERDRERERLQTKSRRKCLCKTSFECVFHFSLLSGLLSFHFAPMSFFPSSSDINNADIQTRKLPMCYTSCSNANTNTKKDEKRRKIQCMVMCDEWSFRKYQELKLNCNST